VSRDDGERRLELLVFNLEMDAASPVLGHATAWVNYLARRCAHVSVITMSAGEIAVEENVSVHSLGKERGYSEPRRLLEFYRLVRRVLRERPIDVCFAHMAPLFAALFAPAAKLRGIPILLWYSHPSRTLTLRIAHRVATRCVTSTPSGFPLRSGKLHLAGHGVDTELFMPPTQPPADYARTVLQVGRLSRIKRVDETLRAFVILTGELGRDIRLRLVGAALTEPDQEYERSLHELCRSAGIEDRVRFEGAVPFREIAARYQQGVVCVNLMESSLDKAVLEAIASGCVPVSRNAGFRQLARDQELEQLIPDPGPEGLAKTIAGVLDLPGDERQQISARLRRAVEEEHSLSSLGDRLMGHIEELAAA
jgi:glycosyltransferase involved in cell wall biosynthesis